LKLSFGTDPEFLLLDQQGNPKSAIGIVKGDPENRIKKKGHEFYYDNVLAECAVKPAFSKEKILNNIRECLTIYAKMVRPYELRPIACIDFDSKELDNEIARLAGCAIDYCAYAMLQKKPPTEIIAKSSVRSCGGHIHLGSKMLSGNDHKPILMIYMMDLFLGTLSVFLDKDPSSSRRRDLYGQAGRYRPKDYGIEYRTLGNFWLSDPELVGLIYDICLFAHEFVRSGEADLLWQWDEQQLYKSNNPSDAWSCQSYEVNWLRHGIDTGDKTMTKPFFELAKALMPENLRKEMERLIAKKQLSDFYSSWGIQG
jgi:hypothetical protein